MKVFYLVCVACIICSIDARSISKNEIHPIESDVVSEINSSYSSSSGMHLLNELRGSRRTKRQIFTAQNCQYGYCRKQLGNVKLCVPCNRCNKRGRC